MHSIGLAPSIFAYKLSKPQGTIAKYQASPLLKKTHMEGGVLCAHAYPEQANSDVMQQRRMQLRDLASVHVMPSFSQFQSRMAILKVTIYSGNQGLVDCRVDRLVFRSFKARARVSIAENTGYDSEWWGFTLYGR